MALKTNTGEICFLQFLFIFHYKQGNLQEKTKHCRSVNASKLHKNKMDADVVCSCTRLCFLRCCLLITTLGVTCVNQLCSVFGHQFDHAWKTKQDHILCQYILISTHLRINPLVSLNCGFLQQIFSSVSSVSKRLTFFWANWTLQLKKQPYILYQLWLSG